jgi:hypothetical protein
VPVRWIDKVLEVALERQPTPLPDEEAKRLCNGLQIRLAQFDSGSRLQIYSPANLLPGLFCLTIEHCSPGW